MIFRTLAVISAALFASSAFAQSCDAPATEITPELAARCQFQPAVNSNSVTNPNAPTDTATILNTTGAVTATFAAGLLTHTLNNYPTQTRISTGNTAGVTGIDFNPAGTTLFAVVNGSATITRSFGVIDRTTGVYTAAPSFTGVAATDNIADMTINPSSGAGFLVTNAGTPPTATANLYRLDTATGVATLVGPISATNFVTGIAANCTGQIFAHDIVSDSLLSVNTTTGLGTVIGVTGYNANFSQGMDFDNSVNTLYGWAVGGAAGAFTYQYGSFNLTTGALSNDASIPASQVKGAIATACPVVGAPTITPVTPAGAVSFTLPANRSFVFNNAATATASGTVTCTISGAGFSVVPTTTQTIPIGGSTTFVVSATAPGTGTLSCVVQGVAQPIVYNLTAGAPVVLIPTPTLSLWSALALLMGLGLFGALTVRRFS